MLGLSLIHVGFLAGGLAITLPIVIHLLFRQKTRVVPIGSVQFLHQVVREHRRRRRLRQWLLLILRILAVLLLALLFARPYWQAAAQGLEQQVVFLVDRSASMQVRGAGSSAFDEAIERLRAELGRLSENAIVHLGLYDASGVEEISLEAVGSARPTQLATNHAGAIAWAKDVLAVSNRTRRRVVVISDLQRTGLPVISPEQLPGDVELAVHDVGERLIRNVSVDSAEAIVAEIRPDGPVRIRATVRNHGPLAVRQLPIQCELEGPPGKVNASVKLDVPGHGSSTVELPFHIDSDGVYRGKVAIAAEDMLPLDDERWLAVELRHPDRVLLVDGQEGRVVFGNETYYLETALRLRTQESAGRLRSFEVERIVWEANWGKGFPRLEGYRAVVLANVRRLSDEDGRRLEQFVRSGGGLLIFAGDQVSSQSLAPLVERNLLPGHVALYPVAQRSRIDRWDTKHVALDCFADPQQGDLRGAEFDKFLPIESLEPAGRMLLATGSTVVAAEKAVEHGLVVYLGFSADRDWTELPRTPLYVPLVRQLLAYLTHQLGDRQAVTNLIVASRSEKAGLTELGEQWQVRHMEPRESIPDRLSPEEFSSQHGGTAVDSEIESARADLDLTLPSDALRADEIWTAVAWFLLIVLVVEMMLASRVHA
jgi:hypothetical protein